MIVVEATICYLEATHCRVGALVERLEVPGVAMVEWKPGEYRNEALYILHLDDLRAYRNHVASLTRVEHSERIAAVVMAHLHHSARAAGATGALASDVRERMSA